MVIGMTLGKSREWEKPVFIAVFRYYSLRPLRQKRAVNLVSTPNLNSVVVAIPER